MAIRHLMEVALDVSDHTISNETKSWWRRLPNKGAPIKTSHPEYFIVPAMSKKADVQVLFIMFNSTPIGYLVMDLDLHEVFESGAPRLYTPHMYLDKAHRGKGLLYDLHEWALESGRCFVSNGIHTPAAYALWQKLGQKFPLFWIDFKAERIAKTFDQQTRARDGVEMLLIGKGHSISQFKFSR